MFNPQLDELEFRKVFVGRTTTTATYSGVQWTESNMIDLKKGDIFKVTNKDGTPYTRSNGKIEYVAATDGYVHPLLNIPTVQIHAR